jgi:tetratricopeptide (TPR) repeat protein
VLSLVHAQTYHQRLDREFQSAVSDYNSGHFAAAAIRLEKLVRELPDSFDVQELLGMVYVAQPQDSKATLHLQRAVQLNPKSAPARTNLATNLVRLGKLGPAEAEFKNAVELEPHNYDTVHNLGEFYVAAKKIPEALPYLEQAQQLKPSSYDNGYDLSLACLHVGRIADARRQVADLLKQRDTAELHNLLAQIEEKDGNSVAAANEFQAAAQLDPCESNLFDWGSELLLHRTLDPAVEVFQKATQHYPNSPRLAIGLGMALYSRGNHDEAVKSLLRATDLDPSDARAYLFLAKAYDSSPNQAEDVIQRFRRFAQLQPENARALYYYAMSLWKGRRVEDATLDLHQIEELLRKAVALHPAYAEAHQQLGNLYSDQKKYAEAIPEYLKALESNPDLGDAHYRLGQAYVRTGQKERAQEQLEVYQKLREQHVAELERQRAEIRQFIYSEKETPAKP